MKKLAWAVVILLLLSAASCSVLTLGKQPKPFPVDSISNSILQPGVLETSSFKETFIDTSRPTAANGDYPGDSVRHMEGKVWHPVSNSQGPYPLIVYSHGFTSTRDGGAYLAEQLASLGYVVVAVNYPLTNYAAPGGPTPRDVVNQPGDVSFLIDTLVAHGESTDHRLAGMVDETRVGVTGISLGGMTTALVTYHPVKRDPRIGAALSIAGPTAVFTDTFFANSKAPFLMLAGDIDAMVPHYSNAAPVIDKIPGSQVVTIKGGSHTGFAGPAAPLRWMSNPDALGCYMVKSSIEEDVEEPWYEDIGSIEQGIDHSAVNELCQSDPLPEAINVLRQQMITSVVVSSFFQSVFAPGELQRERARAFLSSTMAREIPEVNYQRAAVRL